MSVGGHIHPSNAHPNTSPTTRVLRPPRVHLFPRCRRLLTKTCNPRHSPAQADGPLLGNGDLGVMVGVSSRSNLTFWLTKNDWWCLSCGEEPECRYGDFNQTL